MDKPCILIYKSFKEYFIKWNILLLLCCDYFSITTITIIIIINLNLNKNLGN